MRKTTINTILMSVIALMSVSICFLIFCIATRPRYVIVSDPEPAVIKESPGLSSDGAQPSAASPDTSSPVEEPPASDSMHGKTSARVNIRNAASTDAKVLDTVEAGTTFDILEIQDNGWTKIRYQDSEAYISSDFVIVLNE